MSQCESVIINKTKIKLSWSDIFKAFEYHINQQKPSFSIIKTENKYKFGEYNKELAELVYSLNQIN
jgi:hypothetical protein